MKYYLNFILLFFALSHLNADRKFPIPMIDDTPLNYVCYQTTETLSIDGKLEEESWLKSEWTQDFVDIEGNLKPIPSFTTKAKLLWNKDYLYIGAYLEETDLWATLTQRDAVIFHDNDFEVFIDPDGDSHDYYELEVNALNTVWDLLLIKPYRDRNQVAFNSWDIKGLKTAVHLQGSLNDSSDKDEYWSVEIAIPWQSLAEAAHKTTPPLERDIWKINFSRVHWQLDKESNSYKKKINPETKRNLPEMNIVWSPQGLIAMHYPEMWGDVMFTHQFVGNKIVSFVPDELSKEKKYLREIYYLQKEYFLQNGYYASDIAQLNLPKHSFEDYYPLPKIYTSPNTYEIILKSKSDKADLHIFQDGELRTEK